MPTDQHAFLRSRRSIRRFKREVVPEVMIDRLLETATYAPSAHNLQPWRFVVVRDPESRSDLGSALTGKMRQDMRVAGSPESEIEARVVRSLNRLEQAPLVIVLCRDTGAVKNQTPAEIMMAVQSTALAGLQLLLAAHAEGLGGAWICWPLFAPDEAHEALTLPRTWEPQAMFFLGFPDESPSPRERSPLESLTLIR